MLNILSKLKFKNIHINLRIHPKLYMIILFLLPFIIPLWTVSRSGMSRTNMQKIQILNEEAIRFSSKKEYSKSIEHLTSALRLAPNNKTIKKNLASVYTDLAIDLKSKGDKDNAVAVLEEAEQLNTNIETIHSLLAQLYYEKGDLMFAEKEARIALLLKPHDPYLLKFLSYISYLLEDYDDAMQTHDDLNNKFSESGEFYDLDQMQQEQEISANYEKMICHPFVIFYPDKQYYEKAKWVAQALAKVYLRLGDWWGFKPQHKIPVYLYPEEIFLKVTHAGNYTVGLYDGKIRLLVENCEKLSLKKTAMHEYTHHALSCLTNSNAPFWCNEGLAQFVAGQWDDARAKMFDMIIYRNELIDFAQIEDSESDIFDVYDKRLAYLQSFVAVDFLVSVYGDDIILDLINGLKQGKTAQQVINDITLLSYDEFKQEIEEYYTNRRAEESDELASLSE